MKTRKKPKPWTTLNLRLTIQCDENGDVFDVNISDGYRSISSDVLMTLDQILEDFVY